MKLEISTTLQIICSCFENTSVKSQNITLIYLIISWELGIYMHVNSDWLCFSRKYRHVCMFYTLKSQEWNGSKMSQGTQLHAALFQTRNLSSKGCLLVSLRLAWDQVFVLIYFASWIWTMSLSYDFEQDQRCVWRKVRQSPKIRACDAHLKHCKGHSEFYCFIKE